MVAPRPIRGGGRRLQASIALAPLLPALVGSAVHAEMEASCGVGLQLDPERAFVGEQVLSTVRIVRTSEIETVHWLRAPGHPDLPGTRIRDTADRKLDPEQARQLGLADGHIRTLTTVHRPLAPGRYEIAEAVLACERSDGSRAATARTRPARLEVLPLPERDQPGPVMVGALALAAEPAEAELALGESMRWRVEVRAEGDLDSGWPAALRAFSATAADVGVEVFATAARQRTIERERQLVIRTMDLELVPTRSGALALPDLVMTRFDPGSRTYSRVRMPGPRLRVEPRSAAPSPSRADRPSPTRPRAPTTASDIARRPILAPIAAVTLLCAVLLGWPVVQRARRRANPSGAALSEAERARLRDDPAAEFAALERALRLAAGHLVPGAESWRASRLLDSKDERLSSVGAALEALEEARWGDPPRPPRREQVRDLLGSLR